VLHDAPAAPRPLRAHRPHGELRERVPSEEVGLEVRALRGLQLREGAVAVQRVEGAACGVDHLLVARGDAELDIIRGDSRPWSLNSSQSRSLRHAARRASRALSERGVLAQLLSI
jgi:hypothetical protein